MNRGYSPRFEIVRVPYVEDRRNVLIIRPPETFEATTLATLQYALKRGIEAVYQLEESELMAEPLPSRDNRQSILLYESAEGGAGVLTRLATEPTALARVAEEALRIMHFKRPADGLWKHEGLEQELDENGNPPCEAGCYKCLLSYYNQPDHTVIDRQDIENDGKALDVLFRLTRAQGKMGSFGRSPEQQEGELSRISGSRLEQAWLAYVDEHGYRRPDRGQESIPQCNTCADFFYADWKAAIYIDGPHHHEPSRQEKDAAINRSLDDAGFYVVRFPSNPKEWSSVFSAHQDLFGPGLRKSIEPKSGLQLLDKAEVSLRLERAFTGDSAELRQEIQSLISQLTGAEPLVMLYSKWGTQMHTGLRL